MPDEQLPPEGEKKCPRCGTAFRCGIQAGEATCWCFDLPHIIPVENVGGEGCLCPTCLRQWIEQVQQENGKPSALKKA